MIYNSAGLYRMRNITRKDIAEKLGVSVSVVSRVINNSGYVSKEKRGTCTKGGKRDGVCTESHCDGAPAKQDQAAAFLL